MMQVLSRLKAFRAPALLLTCLSMSAQQTPPTEVVLSANSATKLIVALGAPQLSGLDSGDANKDFVNVLQRDLEESGVFSVAKEKLPSATDSASYKLWRDAGADWLVITKLNKGSEPGLEVQVVDTKASKTVQSKRYLGADVSLRRRAHALADDLVRWLTGEAGNASTRLVFVRQTSPGVKELFQMDRDGAGFVQLTRYGSLTLSPSVAPDGRLAYVTYKGGTPEIWGQRRPGGAHERLYPNAQRNDGHCYSPAWSPDGKRIAFVQGDRRGNSDIVVLDVESGRARKLTDGQGINTEPSWNPSGTQLAFTSDREGGPQVYLMQEDGSNLRRLTTEGTYNASPAWSPNGAMIAYVSRFEGKFDLFVFKLGEGKAYQITTGVSTSESPSWSPDERRLVFTSNRAGAMQIYSTDLSGRQVVKLSEMGGTQSPKWTRTR
jgi:TolB protein